MPPEKNPRTSVHGDDPTGMVAKLEEIMRAADAATTIDELNGLQNTAFSALAAHNIASKSEKNSNAWLNALKVGDAVRISNSHEVGDDAFVVCRLLQLPPLSKDGVMSPDDSVVLIDPEDASSRLHVLVSELRPHEGLHSVLNSSAPNHALMSQTNPHRIMRQVMHCALEFCYINTHKQHFANASEEEFRRLMVNVAEWSSTSIREQDLIRQLNRYLDIGHYSKIETRARDYIETHPFLAAKLVNEQSDYAISFNGDEITNDGVVKYYYARTDHCTKSRAFETRDDAILACCVDLGLGLNEIQVDAETEAIFCEINKACYATNLQVGDSVECCNVAEDSEDGTPKSGISEEGTYVVLAVSPTRDKSQVAVRYKGEKSAPIIVTHNVDDVVLVNTKTAMPQRASEGIKLLIPTADSFIESDNTVRANRINYALMAHSATQGTTDASESFDDCAVAALLTDVRHYCDAHQIDFFKAVDNSYTAYLEERDDAKRAMKALIVDSGSPAP